VSHLPTAGRKENAFSGLNAKFSTFKKSPEVNLTGIDVANGVAYIPLEVFFALSANLNF